MIGVFDSGSGGLTVMRALERALPDQSFLYLGDHANAPYGNRSPAEIYSLTLQAIEHLFARGCTLVILACNTAAATGLRQLQQTWLPVTHPSRRVIGVIVPVVEEITGVPWQSVADILPPPAAPSLHVALFATVHTVRTRSYVKEINHRAPGIRVSQKACPDLVRLIEDAAPEDVLRERVRHYVGALLEAEGIPDVCVLGCTHYPLIEHLFVRELPPGVRMVSQSAVTATSLKHYLDRHPEFSCSGTPRREFLTTGAVDHVSALASRFYGQPVAFRALYETATSPA